MGSQGVVHDWSNSARTRATRRRNSAPGVDQGSELLLFCCRSILLSIKHRVKAVPTPPQSLQERREEETSSLFTKDVIQEFPPSL